MRNALDTCSLPGCGGILVYESQYHQREGLIGDVAPVGVHRVHSLYCNACGLVYRTKDRGEDLRSLRAPVWTRVKFPEIESVPTACAKCHGTTFDEDPIELRNRRWEKRRGIYCVTCNTPIGFLPKDPSDD